MFQAILNHLMTRPISSIANAQAESEVGLKLITIIDWMLERKQLYAEILQHPKLLEQLLRFKNFDRFHYYEYKLKKVPFGQWRLECQCCNFVAPYTTTLGHMVLNHGRHISAELCQWCRKSEIRAHIEAKTLEQCYSEYCDENKISENAHVIQLIDEVFTQLRLLAEELGVRTTRNSNYRAFNSTGKEIIQLNGVIDDELSTEVIVKKPMARNKAMNFDRLEQLFKEAMRYFVEDAKHIRYSPFETVCDSSVPQTPPPPMQQMPVQPPQFQQQQQQQWLQQQQQQQQQQHHHHQPSWTQNAWAPPHQANMQSLEITNLANFVTYALKTIRSDEIRTRAHFDIQQNILKFLTDDLQYQRHNQ